MKEIKKAFEGRHQGVTIHLSILKETGQPPVVPAIRKGDVPAELK